MSNGPFSACFRYHSRMSIPQVTHQTSFKVAASGQGDKRSSEVLLALENGYPGGQAPRRLLHASPPGAYFWRLKRLLFGALPLASMQSLHLTASRLAEPVNITLKEY